MPIEAEDPFTEFSKARGATRISSISSTSTSMQNEGCLWEADDHIPLSADQKRSSSLNRRSGSQQQQQQLQQPKQGQRYFDLVLILIISTILSVIISILTSSHYASTKATLQTTATLNSNIESLKENFEGMKDKMGNLQTQVTANNNGGAQNAGNVRNLKNETTALVATAARVVAHNFSTISQSMGSNRVAIQTNTRDIEQWKQRTQQDLAVLLNMVVQDTENDTLRFSLGEITKEFANIRNITRKLDVELNYVKAVLKGDPAAVCGGVIGLPEGEDSITFRYNSTSEYSLMKRCVWTFENTKNGVRQNVNLRLRVISKNIQGDLYALKWNRNVNFTAQELTNSDEYDVTGELLFLSLSSYDVKAGEGFAIEIFANSTSTGYDGSNFVYTAAPGTKSCGPYQDMERISIVLLPSKLTTVTVSRMSSEATYDRLEFYEVKQFGNVLERDRVSGSVTSARTVASTAEPLVIIFSSDGSQTGSGFTISWA